MWRNSYQLDGRNRQLCGTVGGTPDTKAVSNDYVRACVTFGSMASKLLFTRDGMCNFVVADIIEIL